MTFDRILNLDNHVEMIARTPRVHKDFVVHIHRFTGEMPTVEKGMESATRYHWDSLYEVLRIQIFSESDHPAILRPCLQNLKSLQIKSIRSQYPFAYLRLYDPIKPDLLLSGTY